MAENQQTQYQFLFKSFKRLAGFALDDSGIHSSFEDMKKYILEGTAYKGQIMVVLEDETAEKNGLYILPKSPEAIKENNGDISLEDILLKLCDAEDLTDVRINLENKVLQLQTDLGTKITDLDVNLTQKINANKTQLESLEGSVKTQFEQVSDRITSIVGDGSSGSLSLKSLDEAIKLNKSTTDTAISNVESKLEEFKGQVADEYVKEETFNTEVKRIDDRIDFLIDDEGFDEKLNSIKEISSTIDTINQWIDEHGDEFEALSSELENYLKKDELEDKVVEIIGGGALQNILRSATLTFSVPAHSTYLSGRGIQTRTDKALTIPEGYLVKSISINIKKPVSHNPNIFEVQFLNNNDQVVENLLDYGLDNLESNNHELIVGVFDENDPDEIVSTLNTIDGTCMCSYDYDINYETPVAGKIGLFIVQDPDENEQFEGNVSIVYHKI